MLLSSAMILSALSGIPAMAEESPAEAGSVIQESSSGFYY